MYVLDNLLFIWSIQQWKRTQLLSHSSKVYFQSSVFEWLRAVYV